MSFTPVIPTSGLTGWRFLQATYDRQMDAFRSSANLKRDLDYFRSNIQSVKSAEELVADRRLLNIALGAFGLKEDLNNRAFIRTILESAADDPKSLLNRIADPRYKDLAEAFAFNSPFGPKTSDTGFAGKIATRFETHEFEVAVGQISNDMRLALSASRELTALANEPGSDNTKWFKAIGRPPLRSFIETALGLPKDFGKIDLDQQLGVLKSKSESHFGVTSFDRFAEPEIIEKFVQRFQLMTQISNLSYMNSASIAVQLLS